MKHLLYPAHPKPPYNSGKRSIFMKPLIPIQDFVPLSFLLLAIALLSHNKTFLKIAMLFTLPVFFCFVCIVALTP